jgi:tripartite-type tricarboxylate transporter receptor subunit TctC
MNRRDLLKLGVALGGVSLAGSAMAQQYPQKTVTLIVPFAPGGNLDIIARVIAPAMSRALGQPIIVQNRAGAGGAIGTGEVARAEADGYTLLITTPNAITVLPQMVKTNYKLDSFQSIGLAATTSLVLVAKGNDNRFKNAASFLASAKASPKKISVGYAGIGTTNHVAMMLLEDAAKCEFSGISYKGSGPALADLIGGQIDAVVDQLTSSAPHVKTGGLRVLAVMSRERDPLLPDVPTLREAGLSEFDQTTSVGFMVPANTSKATVDILNGALKKALADEQVKNRLVGLGNAVRPSTSQEFQQLLEGEEKRARALAKAGKLKTE